MVNLAKGLSNRLPFNVCSGFDVFFFFFSLTDYGVLGIPNNR